MKAVISTDGEMVSAHFGRCPSFTIAQINDGKVFKIETINNPSRIVAMSFCEPRSWRDILSS